MCPICGAMVKARAENSAFPFCSTRCKTIDLGKWLSEEYRVPGAPVEPGEDGMPTDGHDDRGSDAGDMRH